MSLPSKYGFVLDIIVTILYKGSSTEYVAQSAATHVRSPTAIGERIGGGNLLLSYPFLRDCKLNDHVPAAYFCVFYAIGFLLFDRVVTGKR